MVSLRVSHWSVNAHRMTGYAIYAGMKPHERLQQARLNAGYSTASSAAAAFGWTPSTYLGHENGSRGLRADAAKRYARAFGVSWAWLMGADEGFEEVIDALTPIPVAGVLDPGAYRERGFRLEGIPAELHLQVFGYNSAELEAFVAYGSRDAQHFVISAKAGALALVEDDELIVQRSDGARVETAAWRLERGPRGLELRAVYAPHVSVGREPSEVLNDADVRVIGVVVAEFKVKRRPMRPSEDEE